MVDLFDKLKMEAGPLAKYSYLPDDYFTFPKLEGDIGPHMTFNGKKVLNWSLNNYLGLANHPEVRRVDAESAAQYGLGSPMGARMMSGNSVHHIELEKQLADFIMKEDVMLSTLVTRAWFQLLTLLLTVKILSFTMLNHTHVSSMAYASIWENVLCLPTTIWKAWRNNFNGLPD